MLNACIVNRPSEELEYRCALGILEVCFIQQRVLTIALYASLHIRSGSYAS